MYEEIHKIPTNLYYQQFIQQGGLQHFSGRIHSRSQRGIGLSGGNFLTRLLPLGSIVKGIGRAIIPTIFKTGKHIAKEVGPHIMKSAVNNIGHVVSGRKKLKGALKDTLRDSGKELLNTAVHQGRSAMSSARKRKSTGSVTSRIKKKRKVLKGGGLMRTNRKNIHSARGKKKKTNYMYGDVFDQLNT